MTLRHPLTLATLLSLALTIPQLIPLIGANSTGGEFALQGQVRGGGGTSSASEFELFGGIAEPSAGSSAGSPFALTGGFLPQTTLPLPPGDIFLDLTITTSALQISWPPEAASYTLESTTSLGPDVAWEPVPNTTGQTSLLITPDAHTRFFRLRAP